jgi:deoxyribonuclease-4
MPERTGVCFDTCHAFAAGYDLSSRAGVDDVLAEFHRRTGLERIGCFHMNDCGGACGSHRDRHARIGEGLIGLDPLRYLAAMDPLDGIPGIVETPGTDSDRAEDARALAATGDGPYRNGSPRSGQR